MNKEEILKEREFYYSHIFVLFEIVKCLKNRELCFLSHKGEIPRKTARNMIAFTIDYLKKHFRWINFDKYSINMYHSVARLKPNTIPVFSYNLRERTKTQEYKDFKKEFINFVEGYNLFIDLDGKEDFEKCYQEAKEIKKIFDEYKIPYYLLNSSFKGFHFHVPAEYMPNMEISELLKLINKVVYNIKGIYDFKTIDLSIFDLKRVCKVPYSYECSGAICLPLTDVQFNNFSSKMVSMKEVIKNIKIKNRGLILRTHNLDEKALKENVINFIREFK